MDINSLNGKAPKQQDKKPNFDIIIKTYCQRALDEGVEPEVTVPCGGYFMIVDQGNTLEIIQHGEMSYEEFAMAIIHDPHIGKIVELLILLNATKEM